MTNRKLEKSQEMTSLSYIQPTTPLSYDEETFWKNIVLKSLETLNIEDAIYQADRALTLLQTYKCKHD